MMWTARGRRKDLRGRERLYQDGKTDRTTDATASHRRRITQPIPFILLRYFPSGVEDHYVYVRALSRHMIVITWRYLKDAFRALYICAAARPGAGARAGPGAVGASGDLAGPDRDRAETDEPPRGWAVASFIQRIHVRGGGASLRVRSTRWSRGNIMACKLLTRLIDLPVSHRRAGEEDFHFAATRRSVTVLLRASRARGLSVGSRGAPASAERIHVRILRYWLAPADRAAAA